MQVVTLNEEALSKASRDLWSSVERSGFRPTHVVGIVTGGAVVVDRMRAALPRDVQTVEVSMARPGTEMKRRSAASRILPRLPYAVTDRLRVLEASVLARRNGEADEPRAKKGLSPEDAAKLGRITEAADARVLVVDDAVDSGRTLAAVAGQLRDSAGADRVKTAVIVQTQSDVALVPDFRLFDGVLCRFPWSNDYHG